MLRDPDVPGIYGSRVRITQLRAHVNLDRDTVVSGSGRTPGLGVLHTTQHDLTRIELLVQRLGNMIEVGVLPVQPAEITNGPIVPVALVVLDSLCLE
jgi:hypothetical protein